MKALYVTTVAGRQHYVAPRSGVALCGAPVPATASVTGAVFDPESPYCSACGAAYAQWPGSVAAPLGREAAAPRRGFANNPQGVPSSVAGLGRAGSGPGQPRDLS